MKIDAQNGSRENDQMEACPLSRRGKRISTPMDISTKEMRIAGILAEKGMQSEQSVSPVVKPAAELVTEKSPLLKDKKAALPDAKVNV